MRAPWPAMPALDVGAIMAIGVESRFSGTLAETVRERDLEALLGAVGGAGGSTQSPPQPVALAHGWTAAPPVIVRDSLSRYADLLSKLTDIYAVSGHEQPMRDAVAPHAAGVGARLGRRRHRGQSRAGDGAESRHDRVRRAHGRDWLRGDTGSRTTARCRSARGERSFRSCGRDRPRCLHRDRRHDTIARRQARMRRGARRSAARRVHSARQFGGARTERGHGVVRARLRVTRRSGRPCRIAAHELQVLGAHGRRCASPRARSTIAPA